MATSTMAAARKSAAVTRVSQDSLADVIQLHRNAARERRYEPIGRMLNMIVGPDDEAAYMQKMDVRERIARLSKVQGLQIDWGQNHAPQICWAPHRSSLMFPFGCPNPPRIADPTALGVTRKRIAQDLEDYASGFVLGRDGTRFLVIQPVLYMGVWIMDGLYILVGHNDPATGKYPSLLINPKTSEAHIVGGLIELTTAKTSGQYLPWER